MIARVCAAVVLAGPAALAFARGGYFDEARLWGAVAAWGLVAVAAFAAARPLPRTAPGIVALAGLAGLLAWTLVSLTWAPLRPPAVDDAQRLALYLAVLVAATALLRGGIVRAAAPALAAGIVAATLYGLSERVLPGLVELTRSNAAMGRLDQPLTYWNAMGAWAAIGVVLCARLAGERDRPAVLRMLAAASAAPLGAAVALSFSRGAIAAALIGLGVLAALEPRRRELRAIAVAGAAAVAAGAVAGALPAVRTLEGARESEGLVLLATLAALMAAAALLVRREVPGGDARALRQRVVVPALVGLIVVAAAAVALDGRPDTGTPETGATATRLSSTASNRYAYWEVALSAFADQPLRGGGSGSFSVAWLRERDVDEVVRDAHSLELETAAELGLVGLGLLLLLLGGVVAGARAALGGSRAAAVGPVAALSVWFFHAALDWDWEMPALTLVAIVLAGLLLALADERRDGRAGLPVRVALALVAVALAAGLAVELRSANLLQASRETPGAGGRFDADLDRLERAQRLSLDGITPTIERVRLLLFARRQREAAPLAETIVRREPENAYGWELVRIANADLDPARSREAQLRLERLVRRVP